MQPPRKIPRRSARRGSLPGTQGSREGDRSMTATTMEPGPRAYWMAQGMARATGMHLARAVVEGWLTRGDLATIVARCERCAQGVSCTNWISRIREEAAPDFCAIKPELDALAPLK